MAAHEGSRGRGRRAVVACALLVAVAACSAPGGQEAHPRQAGDDDTISIGVLAPTTGPVAASGQDMLDGWNLYFEQHGSTIAGKQVESIDEDTAGDPATALNKTQRLVEGEGVDFVVGPLLANVGLAVAEEMSRQNVPMFVPVPSADDLTQRQRLPGVVRVAGWTSSQTTHPLGQWAYDQGYRRVVTMCTDYAFGHETCGGFVNTFTDAGGTIVKQLWHPLGTQDFSTYMAQIKDTNADAAFVETVGAESPKFVKTWSEFGMKGKMPLLGGETTLDQSQLRGMGKEAEGLMSVGHFAEGRQSGATADFAQAYEDAYGKLPSYYSAAMYTAAQWLTKAIEKVDGNLQNRKEFLAAVRDVTLKDSAFGPMHLDGYDNPVFNVYLRKVESRNGTLQNVPTKTFGNVSQFWRYDPKEFLRQPVYSRGFQGKDGG